MTHKLNVVVEGCLHGELDAVYGAIMEAEAQGSPKVDLLIVCGDFQSVRESADLDHMAVKDKFKKLGDFHEYAKGSKKAPCLTVFVGGNHEASNVLQSLYYGGWVAPNIYFLGFAGVINICGVRIAGCSGIFKPQHFSLGHYEEPPYNESDKRSVYHTRELEVYRLHQLQRPVDIMLSHDWPTGVWNYGNCAALLRWKPFLRDEVAAGELGSPAYMSLLQHMRPAYWFAAHLHCKFAAVIMHPETQPPQPPPPPLCPPSDSHASSSSSSLPSSLSPPPLQPAICAEVSPSMTRFLALDKVIPGRDFMQFLQISVRTDGPVEIQYDAEWLAILHATHSLLCPTRHRVVMPQASVSITADDIACITQRFEARNGTLAVPAPPELDSTLPFFHPVGSVQTDVFLDTMGLPHIWTRPVDISLVHRHISLPPAAQSKAAVRDPCEIDLDEEEDFQEQPVTKAVDDNEIDIDST